MTVETNVFLLIVLSSVLGLAAGIFWPYANAWFMTDDPNFKFEWRKILGRVVGGVLGFVVSAGTLTQIQELANLVNDYQWVGYVLSFGTMFAYAYAGREAQKSGKLAVGGLRKRLGK